jgi:tetratricopeptide (TPR) repeat protein
MDRPGETIGPYRLTARLGHGAMSTVYRAEHLASGRSAALKIVETPEPHRLRAIRREIQVLAQLQHPGVVRVLDEGLHEGAPWYAMELVEGLPLTEAAASRPGPERLRILARLCRTLAWLHGEGLVHRDLKPHNVLVRPGLTPVLLDFGLVSRFAAGGGREPLQTWEAAAGTVEYMAPEQIRNAWVDARADLYSVGCLLYELLAGRPPFVGSPARVVRGHLRETPEPPSRLAPDVDPRLDALVERLLAKDPRERLGHADTAAAALEAVAGAAEAWPVPPRPYLYRPGLAGREPEMQELRRHLDEASAGAGRFVLVTGESGVGKTRLAMELGHEAHGRVSFLAGQGLAPQPGADSGLHALRPLLQAAADRCLAPEAEELRRALLGPAVRLALFEPALAAFAGDLPGPEVERLPPDEARRVLADAVADLIEALARPHPLCLVLDDLQWADELTLEVLRHLLHSGRLARLRVLLVGLERAEEPVSVEIPGAHRLRLGRLDPAAVGPIVRDMLAVEAAPEALARFLGRQSEGNPLFVAEYLRAAVAAGLLARDAGGRWVLHGLEPEPGGPALESLPLPGTLHELLRKRLGRLSPLARGVLERASVLGRRFGSALLEALGGQEPGPIAAALGELFRAQVLEALDAESLQFVHDLVREAARAAVSADRQAELHRAAAETLEARPDLLAGLGPGELAGHWQQAGEPARAAPYFLEAAREALRGHAHGDAERLYRTYLGLGSGPPLDRLAARHELGRQMLLRARSAEAREPLEQALREAEALGETDARARVLCSLGEADWRDARHEQARERFELALGLARACGAQSTEALALDRLANVANEQGQAEAAMQMFRQALALHERLGDRLSEALSLTNLAVYHHNRGRLAEAEALYRRALELHRAVGHRRLEGGTLGNLGIARLEQGQFAEAEALLTPALGIVREAGDRRTEALVLMHLATARFRGGSEIGVEALYEEALRLLREIGARPAEGEALLAYAVLRLAQGDGPEARRLSLEALGLLREAGGGGMLGRPTLELARQERLWEDRPAEALRHALAAREAVREAGNAALAVLCACEEGHALLAQGLPAEASLAEARRIVSEAQVDSGEAAEAIGALAQAVQAAASGRPLLRGSRAEDLPPALRRALLRRGARPTAPVR